ncbi:uncharacterized protein LOC122061445 [Macadamia integrifolia]|uniref:uncharacterized protein LOC122061445 n=1 Tax=Macadamia integrifolia TaxID=60698 RepID=UPI001C531F51|nr:uncharacterized protein LOC122061445 [Macadamia integrifolia]
MTREIKTEEIVALKKIRMDSEREGVTKGMNKGTQSNFVDNAMMLESARLWMHSLIVNYAYKFKNKAVLLIHFSASYRADILLIFMGVSVFLLRCLGDIFYIGATIIVFVVSMYRVRSF